eukprot:TRINITY_DN617_c4_g1_i2.p1 TRINITY_DN617_c4_g1~~TRINITY_DN617_c4_g1_i2.p1  ORF type:complete len:493 (+),score=96.36 TRINITY_DN617_c4_g1_i2:191-1669(+)
MATRLKKVAAPSSKRKVRNPLLPHPSTKPLSSAASSKEDQRSTNELQDYLKSLKAYESSTRSQFRETAFQILEFILKKWTTEVVNLKKQGKLLPPDTPSKVDFRVLTFGSFALGVHDPTSDIDVVVVVPQFIDYEDFFYVLPKKLREDNAVSEVTIIADAFVPVIKFKIGSCDIDLLLARLSVNTLPENDDDFLDDKYVMQSVTDHRSVKSINGYRVARAILELVSDEHTFHTTLRFVKCWAKARGIYSNVLGYLGGISWAILTMFVCQYYPNHSPSTLIVKFFQFYSAVWDWRDAVRLTSVVEYPDQPANFPAKTWNPKTNTRDQGHIMSVITPAWPASNSTYNVSQSTLEVMRREFSRGHSVLSQYLDKNGIPRNKADVSAQAVWKTVLTKIDFFQLYRNYLRIDICAENASDFRKWKGYVEAKLRSLIQYLEGLTHLAKVHPLPEFFDVPNTNRVQKSCFFGLDFTYPTIGVGFVCVCVCVRVHVSMCL